MENIFKTEKKVQHIFIKANCYKSVQLVESGLPKKKHVLTEAQKENLQLGRAIAWKN